MVLRFEPVPGDKLLVDYAGLTMAVIDSVTGEERPAQIFVAALGHSGYTYTEATWTQSAVLVVERWILAPLRDGQFFSLAALNARPFQKREDSRQRVFETVERGALRPLPRFGYEYATWKKTKVHLDYHVELERRYYSVPYALVGKTVELRIAARAIEVLYQGQRVAAHLKGTYKGQFTTEPSHRPPAHQAVIELNHERILRRAEVIGEATAAVIRAQADRRKHRDETLRSSLGILRLAHDVSPEQLGIACQRALELRSVSYRALVTLLKSAPPIPPPPLPKIVHENLRGAAYFAGGTPTC